MECGLSYMDQNTKSISWDEQHRGQSGVGAAFCETKPHWILKVWRNFSSHKQSYWSTMTACQRKEWAAAKGERPCPSRSCANSIAVQRDHGRR